MFNERILDINLVLNLSKFFHWKLNNQILTKLINNLNRLKVESIILYRISTYGMESYKKCRRYFIDNGRTHKRYTKCVDILSIFSFFSSN